MTVNQQSHYSRLDEMIMDGEVLSSEQSTLHKHFMDLETLFSSK